jgi:Zn-dependent M16 (insulinase) family peptidase
LHRALREQGGAYGGGAAYDNDTGTFRFYSYRDPRLEETLADFDASLSWLQNHSHQPRSLEEAILTTISRIDRPLSPAGEAISAFFSQIHGRTPEKRRAFRQRILQVSLEDLQSVAQKYLQPTQAHVAVVSDAKRLEKVSDLGLERQSL